MISPLAIFAYNRPTYLKKSLESLKKNELASKTIAYFFIDFPNKKNDLKNNNEVIKIITESKIFKSKIIIKRKYNYGLKKNILNGINYVLKKHKTIIVLEDDLYLSKHFLTYINTYLEYFKNFTKLASIHGYCYPIDKKNLDNFFLIKGADCWGWATWRRAWKHYNDDHKFLAKEIKKKNTITEFNFNNSFNYYDILKNRKSDSWAVNWYASAFVKNMLTLYPKNSYVKNIGNSGLGTHSAKTDKRFDVNLNKNFIFKNIAIKENFLARKKFEMYFKYNFKKKYFFLKIFHIIYNYIKKILKKLKS